MFQNDDFLISSFLLHVLTGILHCEELSSPLPSLLLSSLPLSIFIVPHCKLIYWILYVCDFIIDLWIYFLNSIKYNHYYFSFWKNWGVVDLYYYVQVYNIVIHYFERLYAIYSYHKILAFFPVLYNISLYFIYFIHSSLYFLLPYIYSSLPPFPLLTGNH